jgi:uncharacterized protein YecE (DUF72 family)
MSTLRIGISGWTYRPWRGTFYPEKWVQKRELEYASRQVNSIEINGSFYSLQTPSSYGLWYEQTPDDFVFSVKGGRYITHLRRLKAVEEPLANFFASGVLRLGRKLGPILWQLPPMLPYDPDRLQRFFDLLPRDTEDAVALARRHDTRVKGRAWTKTDQNRPLRHALEVRHPSYETPEFVDLLREHRIGLVVADTAGKWPLMEDVTADFVYLRLHGAEELYVSGYTEEALDAWARKIRTWAAGGEPAGARRLARRAPKRDAGRDIYAYFDNDVKVRSPYDAMLLAHKLGQGSRPPPGPSPETIAEVARVLGTGSDTRWQFGRVPAKTRAPARPQKPRP